MRSHISHNFFVIYIIFSYRFKPDFFFLLLNFGSVTVEVLLESIIPAMNSLKVYSACKCSISLVRQNPAH